MNNNQTSFLSDNLYKTGPGFHVLMALIVFLVYGQLLSIGHRFPEYANFYDFNNPFGWRDWFSVYNPFRLGWYRPTAFNLYFQAITPWVGWHNFAGFQWIAFLTQILLGSTTWIFAKYGLKFDSLSAALAGLFVSVHPVFNMLAVDLINFDGLYQIFILLAFTLWLTSIRLSASRLLGFLFFSILALTSKEQAVAIPLLMAFLFCIDWFFDRRRFPFREVSRVVAFSIVTIVSLVILATRFLYMTDSAEGTYRTGLDLGVVGVNCIAGMSWVFRVFLFNSPSWDNVRELLFHPLGILVGVSFVALTVFYLLSSRSDKGEQKRILIILSLIAAFLVLPVYSGGRPWHFGLPAIGIMLLVARGFVGLLSRFRLNALSQGLLVNAFLLLVVTSSNIELSGDQLRRADTTRIVREAMDAPPVSSDNIPSGAHILYASGSKQANWAFGGGLIFRYAFLRTDINEHVVPSLMEIDPQTLGKIPMDGSLYVFEYVPSRSPAWVDISDDAIPILRGIKEGRDPAASTEVDFTDSSQSQFFITGDWSAAESWGRWTDGTKASVRVRLPKPAAGGVQIHVRFRPFVTQDHPELRVAVQAGSRTIQRWVLSWPDDAAMAERILTIPPSVAEDEYIILSFLIENPASPLSLGYPGSDGRLLGLGMEKVWLEGN